MFLQVGISSEFLATNTTGYFTPTVVRLLMSLTSASVCKFLATHFALIVLVSHMNELMPPKGGGVRKFLPTPVIGAGKWLLPTVSSHVGVQMIICSEFFLTDFAMFGFDSFMDQKMFIQIFFLKKLQAALTALDRDLELRVFRHFRHHGVPPRLWPFAWIFAGQFLFLPRFLLELT